MLLPVDLPIAFSLRKIFTPIILGSLFLLNTFSCTGQVQRKVNPIPSSVETSTSQDSAKATFPLMLSQTVTAEGIPYNQLKDGKKEGLWRDWWDNGALAFEGYFKNGKANGPMKWYNEEGQLVAFGDMVNGQRNGLWKICDLREIHLCVEGLLVNEKEEGPWKSYHENGQLRRENTWKAGKMIASKCWDENGAEMDCSTSGDF